MKLRELAIFGMLSAAGCGELESTVNGYYNIAPSKRYLDILRREYSDECRKPEEFHDFKTTPLHAILRHIKGCRAEKQIRKYELFLDDIEREIEGLERDSTLLPVINDLLHEYIPYSPDAKLEDIFFENRANEAGYHFLALSLRNRFKIPVEAVSDGFDLYLLWLDGIREVSSVKVKPERLSLGYEDSEKSPFSVNRRYHLPK